MKELALWVRLGFNFAGKAAVYYDCIAINAAPRFPDLFTPREQSDADTDVKMISSTENHFPGVFNLLPPSWNPGYLFSDDTAISIYLLNFNAASSQAIFLPRRERYLISFSRREMAAESLLYYHSRIRNRCFRLAKRNAYSRDARQIKGKIWGFMHGQSSPLMFPWTE